MRGLKLSYIPVPEYGAVLSLTIINIANGHREWCFVEYDEPTQAALNGWVVCNRMLLDKMGSWPVQTYLKFINATQTLTINQTWFCEDEESSARYVANIHRHPCCRLTVLLRC